MSASSPTTGPATPSLPTDEGATSTPKKRGRPKGSKNKPYPATSPTSDAIPPSRQPTGYTGYTSAHLSLGNAMLKPPLEPNVAQPPRHAVPPVSPLSIVDGHNSKSYSNVSGSASSRQGPDRLRPRPDLPSRTTPPPQRYLTAIEFMSWDGILQLPVLGTHQSFSSQDFPTSFTEAVVSTFSSVDNEAGPSKKRPVSDDGNDSTTTSLGSQPAAKRPRTTSSFYRHPRFWFGDGSVVIRCEDVFFWVHKSLLEQKSSWFSDWFSQKQDQEDEEDGPPRGCSIYHIKDLHPVYFDHLLEVIYDGIDFLHKSPSFPILDSLLRISYNLGFKSIGDWASGLLQEIWYTELNDFDSESIMYAAESIALARNLGIPGVTKRAFLELLRSPGFANQMVHGDGGQANPDAGGDRHPLLSARDTTNLIHAREKLVSVWIDSVATIPAQLAQKCAHLDAQVSEKLRPVQWLMLVHESGIFKKYLYDPISGLHQLCYVDWSKGSFCPTCIEVMKNLWENEREKLWKDVDVWLGL